MNWQTQKAIDAYKNALRLNPSDEQARKNLALCKRQQQKQKQQQQQQQQNNQDQEMSKENAEQLLESAMQDEKEVQEKVKKLLRLKGRNLEKDW